MATMTAPPAVEEQQEEDIGVGVKMTADFAAAAWDPERDAFTKQNRVDAWDRIEDRHQARKDLKKPFNHSALMVSGDMGVGKSLIAGRYAAHYYEQGMSVYSNASLLFGTRIVATELYTFIEQMEPNSVLWIDEPHLLADRYGENSIRQRSLSNCMSLLRKMGIRVIFSTVHEERTAYSLKGPVETLIYPQRYRPRTRHPKFPPWCYVQCTLIGPNPFQGRRMSDEWGIVRPQGECRKVVRPPIPPLQIYQTAKLIDSWEKPDILEGIRTTAQDIRNGVGRLSQEQVLSAAAQAEQFFKECIANAINMGHDFGNRPLPWQQVVRAAKSYGWRGEDKAGLKILKVVLKSGLDSQYKVRIPDLMDLFTFANSDEPQSVL